MKKTDLTIATDRFVELQIKALDRFLEETVEPLADIGNPEKLIDKKYEEWTPEDLQMLTQIYGTEEPSILSDFIFRKEYEIVKTLEQEA